MFNFKYNILAVLSVLVGFISSILQIKIFGVSDQTDAYMIGFSIVAALNMFQLMLVEQFMFFYNDYKIENSHKAQQFYHSVITVSLLGGILFYILSLFIIDKIIWIFASGFEASRLELLKKILYIHFATTIFFPLNFVNDQLLNAEMKISVPYILNIFPNFAILCSYIFIIGYNYNNIVICIYFHLIGYIISFLLRFFYIRKKLCISLKLHFDPLLLKNFLINSFSMRFAHNMHNLIVNPITNNILSHMPLGSVSCYYYADKFIMILQSVMAGPSNIILGSKISLFWSSKNYKEIIHIIKKFLKIVPGIFMLSCIVVYIFIPFFFKFISSSNVSKTEISIIQFVFLLMALWQLVILIEAPYVRTILASKKSNILLLINSQFIVIYFILTRFLIEYAGIYSITISCCIGQVLSVILFIIFSKKILNNLIRSA